MNLLKAGIAISATGFCCLCLCLAGPTAAGIKGPPVFKPGREYHVKTDNEAIGTKSFNVYIPLDYTDDRDWPVIFRYKGRGEKYNPIICRDGRMITCDRGAIVIGMGYLNPGEGKIKPTEFADYVGRELRSIYEAKELVSKHLRIDNERLFISGSSAGGWLASLLLEYRSQFWAGALIFVAGRHPTASLLTNQESVRSFQGMPIFFGSSPPPASHGANHKWAKRAEKLYKQRGAIVTFQTYRTDWLVCCPLLRDWTRTYILDSTGANRGKWRRLTRARPEEIDSTPIIKRQIAEQLNKQPAQLTENDLIGIKELSLMGEDVSDTTYITKLANLESLDISFTHVDDVKPLLDLGDLHELNISGTLIKDVVPLKNLPRLDSLSMWNLWLDREQIDELKVSLPNLKIKDYQWDLYEKDSIGRVRPKLIVELN
ncbi:MAG: prolyl oligopeptidase family serine peptidase [Planctomycetota bacterium]